MHKMIKQGVATKADGLKVDVKVNEADMQIMQVEDGLTLSKMLRLRQKQKRKRKQKQKQKQMNPQMWTGMISAETGYLLVLSIVIL